MRAGDILYLSGTKKTIGEYHKAFPGTKASSAPPRPSAFVEAVGDAEDAAEDHGLLRGLRTRSAGIARQAETWRQVRSRRGAHDRRDG